MTHGLGATWSRKSKRLASPGTKRGRAGWWLWCPSYCQGL